MKTLTPAQVAQFVYWLQDHHTLRGIVHEPGIIHKLAHTEKLIDVFFARYPEGQIFNQGILLELEEDSTDETDSYDDEGTGMYDWRETQS